MIEKKIKINTIIFISGNGTNLQHVINNYHKNNHLNIALVVSNIPTAYGLQRATKANIPTLCIPHTGKTREQHETEIISGMIQIIDINKIDYILCLGYMRIITSHFLEYLKGVEVQIYNLHPALPGDDKLIGANCIERAYQQFLDGERTTTGVMIHEMIEDVDRGDCIVYKKIDMSAVYKLEDLQLFIGISEKLCLDEFIEKLSR
jgi:phosphoribosylglycinamide formyltransferase